MKFLKPLPPGVAGRPPILGQGTPDNSLDIV